MQLSDWQAALDAITAFPGPAPASEPPPFAFEKVCVCVYVCVCMCVCVYRYVCVPASWLASHEVACHITALLVLSTLSGFIAFFLV